MRVYAYNNAGDGYETEIIPCQTLEDGNHQDIIHSFGQFVLKENLVSCCQLKSMLSFLAVLVF